MSDIDNRFWAVVLKTEPLDETDLQELRVLLSQATRNIVAPHNLGRAQLRVELELISAIRQFDKASARLVETTNKLTHRMLLLTFVATILAEEAS